MNYSDHLNQNYPVRNSSEEKSAFRKYILSESEKLGFDAKTEKTSDGKNENIIIGDVKTAKVVFSAHFDTPFTSLFPNIMIPRNKFLFFAYQFVPVILLLAVSLGLAYFAANFFFEGENINKAFFLIYVIIYYALYFLLFRTFKNKRNHNDNTSGVATVLTLMANLKNKEKAAFILFDNEEKGKKGSAAYFKDHKDIMGNKLLINFDCVANGKNIVFIAKEAAENTAQYTILKEAFTSDNDFKVFFYPMKGSECNSDYKNFPMGIVLMACKNTKKGLLYTPKIHTSKDTEAYSENITFISERMAEFINKI